MKHYILALLFMASLSISAQEQRTWEQVWQEMNCAEDMEDDEWEDTYERLSMLADNPLDLNHCSREDLEQLPFLSDQQVMDLVEYLDRYGPMRSMNELKMIRSMTYRQITLLPFFVFLGDTEEQEPTFPRWQNIARYGKHTLTATMRYPFYERKGDRDGYVGYPYRHSLRYEFTYGNYVKAGLMGLQDAGEPFFANCNTWGYDTYSYYVQVKKLGALENAIVGKYKVSAGMGLVLNTSFTLGKLATLQNMGRQTNTLRPHSSRSNADYFQGAAATVRLSKPLSLTAFVSYRPTDGTLNDDGTVATIVTNGYHRTLTEIEKKDNTHQTTAGGSIGYRQNGFHLNANTVYTHLDRSLEPNTQTLYRRYYPQGTDFVNASLDYGYTHHRYAFSGETAVNKDGALATINTFSYQPSSLLGLMVLQRFYSYRYSGLHAHSFGNSSRVQNESGIYVGFTSNPIRNLHLQGYADYAYYPWARYQVSEASEAWDFLLQADYQLQRWNLQARQRLCLRQKDNETKDALMADNEQRTRLSATYASPTGWSAKTQADFTQADYKEKNRGWMLSEHLSYQLARLQMSLMAGYFDTDDYASRTYIYERQLQHEFYFPSFYGNGVRVALFAKADITKSLRLSAKVGYTNYFDRSTIGTALQEINGSSMTDLDLQVRWKF